MTTFAPLMNVSSVALKYPLEASASGGFSYVLLLICYLKSER